MLATNGLAHEGDAKELIKEKMDELMAALLRAAPVQGLTARAITEGKVDIKASVLARAMLNDSEIEGAVRAMLGRNQSTMGQLYDAARKDETEQTLTQALEQCAPALRELCPHCFNLDTGEGTRDSRHHSRYECQAPSRMAPREHMNAVLAERAARLGPPFSVYEEHALGACAQAPGGLIADACTPSPDPSRGHAAMWFDKDRLRGGEARMDETPTTTLLGGAREVEEEHWPLTAGEEDSNEDDSPMVHLQREGGKSVTVSRARLQCLRVQWQEEVTSEKAFKQAAAELLDCAERHQSETRDEGDGAARRAAAVHPALLMWINRCMRVQRELLASPIATTAGIFLEESEGQAGREGHEGQLRTTAPTVIKGTVPDGQRDQWRFKEEDTDDAQWANTPWTESGVVALPVQAGDENHELLGKVLAKCKETAGGRKLRAVLLAEIPLNKRTDGEETQLPPFNVKAYNVNNPSKQIRARHLMEIPANRMPWVAGKEWKRDAEGHLHSEPTEGSATGYRRDESAGGNNRRAVQMWMYAPIEDTDAGVVTDAQTRELARIMACISTGMRKTGDRFKTRLWQPATTTQKGHEERGTWTDMSLHKFTATERFDPLEGLKVVHKATDDEGGPQEHLVDGVAAPHMAAHYEGRGASKMQARTAVAALMAGQLHDAVAIYEAAAAATAASFCASVGATVGTMNVPVRAGAAKRAICECCGTIVTSIFRLPAEHETKEIQEAITRIQRRRARRIRDRELCHFATETGPAATPERAKEINKMTVGRLRKALRELGTTGTGTKGELVQRMLEEDAKDAATRGPPEITQHIFLACKESETFACINCASPALTPAEATVGEEKGTQLWRTMCAMAQGKPLAFKRAHDTKMKTTPQEILGKRHINVNRGDEITIDGKIFTVALVAQLPEKPTKVYLREQASREAPAEKAAPWRIEDVGVVANIIAQQQAARSEEFDKSDAGKQRQAARHRLEQVQTEKLWRKTKDARQEAKRAEDKRPAGRLVNTPAWMSARSGAPSGGGPTSAREPLDFGAAPPTMVAVAAAAASAASAASAARAAVAAATAAEAAAEAAAAASAALTAVAAVAGAEATATEVGAEAAAAAVAVAVAAAAAAAAEAAATTEAAAP